jgi:dCMP deaminase
MRPTWDAYFMQIARDVSARGTCDRKQVGCVLVRDRQILATGYNGSMPGEPHCDEAGHFMVAGHCQRSVHAEANAVAQAAKHGVKIEGATCYVTASPCFTCFKLLINAGIRSFVCGEFYRDDTTRASAEKMGISFVILN